VVKISFTNSCIRIEIRTISKI